MKFRKPCNGIRKHDCSLIFLQQVDRGARNAPKSVPPMWKSCLSVNFLFVLCVRSWVCTDICQLKFNRTSFVRTSVPVGKSPTGVAFGILWIGSVVRANVATLTGVAFGISRTITKRLDLTSGSAWVFVFVRTTVATLHQSGHQKKVRSPFRLFGSMEYDISSEGEGRF